LFILSRRTFGNFDVMTEHHLAARRALVLPIALGVLAMLVAACGGGTTEVTSAPASTGAAEGTVATDAPLDAGAGSGVVSYDFPTGEPVLVPVGYTHPRDHVDNTGAFLPTNGKPTLVFVDAIW
jgi:cytochrome oxidase Cu insertion factor (SCO1/SenC/PrrC family)